MSNALTCEIVAMTKPRSKLSEYIGSQAFLDAANRAVKKAIEEAEAAGLPRAYAPQPVDPDNSKNPKQDDERYGETTRVHDVGRIRSCDS